MKIAFNLLTLNKPYSGVQRATKGMINSFAPLASENGFEVSAYVAGKFDTNELCNVDICKTLLPAANRTLRILWEQFVLGPGLAKIPADVVHCPCYVAPAVSFTPVILNIHDVIALTHPDYCTGTNRAYYTRMLPKSAQKARKIIVPTEAVKKDLLANIKNIEEDKISIIPWGIEENFKPVEDIPIKEKTAIQYGLPPKFILHVGRNEPKKNTVKMVEAYFAATMAAKLPHRLVMAGPKGWGMSSFDKAIRELGLEDRVVRLGYVPDKDLATIYSMADATLFPSLVEGFGFPVLESMACGTPVIAGDIPSLREVASSAAHFVNPESLPSIREGIEVILQDEARRNTLIEKGYRQAAKFTWQRHAESLVKLYKTIFD